MVLFGVLILKDPEIPIPPTPDPFGWLSWSSEAKAWLESSSEAPRFFKKRSGIHLPGPQFSTSPVTFCCKNKTVTTTNPNV